MASIKAVIQLLGGTFDSEGKAMKLLFKGMQELEESKTEGPATTPHEWGEHINPALYSSWAWPVKQAVVKLVLAQFFGWRASSVQSILTKDVRVGPIEGAFKSVEFGTTVFKRK